jgi:hypothetical protein
LHHGLLRQPQILEKPLDFEDNPPMVTLKADNRSRVKLPDVKPGTVFEYTNNGPGRFNLVEVQPKDAPVVKPIKRKNGLYMLPVKVDRKEIIAAIRADRDSQ